MAKTTQPFTVNYEVSTGTHNFYCADYYYDPKSVQGSINPMVITVLVDCVNRSTMYAGSYETPSEWRLVGDVDIRSLPEPKVIEVNKGA